MDVFRVLKTFTPQELEFLKTEKINAVETPGEWITFFKKLLHFDNNADSTRKKYMAIAIVSLLLVPIIFFVVMTVFAIIIPIEYSFLALIPAFFVALIFAGISIYAFVKYFKLRKYNIKCNDAIKEKVFPILSLLREEVNPNEKVKLQLDLTDPMSSAKFVAKSPKYAKGIYHKVIDSDYKNDWMNGETKLSDGTILIWGISDLVRQQKKSKRNPRGKYKTKYKYKNKTLVNVQAGLERKKFFLPPKLKQKGEEGLIRTQKQGKHIWMQVKRTFKHGENSFHPKYFIDTVASVYMRAKPQGGN